ncbi:hypothetical protein OQA88_12650 [Cercophora sp. LCS_1]
MDDTYVYSPLDCEKQEIRLFRANRLLDRTNSFGFSLLQITLNEAGNLGYIALSYVWGDPHRTSPVILENGRVLLVTENLRSFIDQFFSHSVPDVCYLWIDSICINQDDAIEKSWQVQQMRCIYELASKVLAWLGPTTNDSDVAMDCFERIAQEVEDGTSELLASFREFYGFTPESPGAKVILNPWASPTNAIDGPLLKRIAELVSEACQRDDFPLDALTSLFRRPWWERAWVLQEAQANDVVVVSCGAKRTKLSHIQLVFQGLESCSYRLEAMSLEGGGRRLTQQQQRILRWGRNELSSIATPLLEGGVLGCTLEEVLERMHGPGGEASRRVKASDPRDLVFAMLGLPVLRDTVRAIVPDYTKTCRDVFIETARALIVHGATNMLWYCSTPDSADGIDGLPSWVPDWSSTSISPVAWILKMGDYWPTLPKGNSPSPEPQFWTGNVNKFSIEMVGYELGRVQNIYRASAYITPDNKMRAAWHTAILGSRPFVTANGYLGIGTSALRQNDMVVLIPGIRAPWILRGVAGGKARLVGPAYVHGIMRGEWMTTSPRLKQFTVC